MADQMFPNSRINNPYALAQIGPDAVAQQYKTQMQQRLADMLMMDGQQQPQGQMVSGHYVAPSPFQYLSGLASTGLGVAAYNQIPEQQAQYAQALRQQAMGEANRLTRNAQMTNPQASSAALANGGGQTNSNAQTMQSYQGGQSAPLSGIDPNVVADILINGGPTQLAEFIRGVNMPTDTLKNYRAAGMSTQQIAQAISGKATADTAIEGGKWVQGPNGPQFMPDMKNGIYGGFVNGAPVAAPISGWGQATAANERPVADAQNASKAQFTPATMVDERGNDVATNTLVTSGNAPAPGGKPPVIKRNPVLQESEKGLNDDWMKNDYRTAISNSESASNLVNTIKAMRMVDTNTGWGEGVKGSAASVLGALGVKDAANYASKQEKFQALAMDRLQTELMKQKGPQTEGDAQRASQTFVRLGNTPATNEFILDFAEAKARQDIRKAAFFQEAVNQPHAKGDLQQINTVWNKIQGSIFDDPILAKYKE